MFTILFWEKGRKGRRGRERGKKWEGRKERECVRDNILDGGKKWKGRRGGENILGGGKR